MGHEKKEGQTHILTHTHTLLLVLASDESESTQHIAHSYIVI